jgi:hypothetical protein
VLKILETLECHMERCRDSPIADKKAERGYF